MNIAGKASDAQKRMMAYLVSRQKSGVELTTMSVEDASLRPELLLTVEDDVLAASIAGDGDTGIGPRAIVSSTPLLVC